MVSSSENTGTLGTINGIQWLSEWLPCGHSIFIPLCTVACIYQSGGSAMGSLRAKHFWENGYCLQPFVFKTALWWTVSFVDYTICVERRGVFDNDGKSCMIHAFILCKSITMRGKELSYMPFDFLSANKNDVFSFKEMFVCFFVSEESLKVWQVAFSS